MSRRALVLAGGAYAASAWEIGVITGLFDAGVDVRTANRIIGTSAGARVALYLASEVVLEHLFERQIGPNPRPSGSLPIVNWPRIGREVARAKKAGGGPAEILRRIGSLALYVVDPDVPNRRNVVAAQLPMQHWPERELLMVAVDAETGERRAFHRESGIDVVDAVIATTAFFGWPPAVFEGHHYIDGGFYSTDNADLAKGFDRVLILALQPRVPPVPVVTLETNVEILRDAGTDAKVIHPDEEAVAAFASVGSVTDPAICGPAARAGRAQGRRLAASLATFWP